jgi:hypothetical protein
MPRSISSRCASTQAIGEDWRVQYQRLHFKEGDGFGTTTRGDLDYLISRDRIVRWTNQFEYGEETDGVEWGTRLSYQLRLSEKDALSYFGAIAGETDPEHLTQSYALGVQYRRNFLRPGSSSRSSPLRGAASRWRSRATPSGC